MPEPLRACPSPGLHGRSAVPGDKSISHRVLMLGALAIGETTISGLLEAEDVINTARAMAALGAAVERWRDGSWHVRGLGIGGFFERTFAPEGLARVYADLLGRLAAELAAG